MSITMRDTEMFDNKNLHRGRELVQSSYDGQDTNTHENRVGVRAVF